MLINDKYRIVEQDYDNVSLEFHDAYNPATEFSDAWHLFNQGLTIGTPILNIGGSLPECREFTKLGYKVTNIDVSNNMLRHISQSLPQVRTVKQSISEFGGESFDGVWACRSLIHIPPEEIADVLRKTCRLLNMGGRAGFVFFTTKIASIEEQTVPEEHSSKKNTFYYRVLYPPDKLVKLFRSVDAIRVDEVIPCRDKDGDACLYIQVCDA